VTETVNELAQRQILAAAEQALRRADAYGVVPTPLGAVGESAGVEAVVDISELPTDVVPKRSRLRKWLGAYLFRAETAFVDLSQPRGRARFIEAHEIGHRVVPWHRGAYVDDEQTLFRDTELMLELEANLAAAHLIFQGRPFFERALDYPLSLRTPLLLADEFDASLHATIRYYVEQHVEPVAVLICGKHRRLDGTVPIFVAVESAAFRQRFGPIGSRFPSGAVPLDDTGPLGPLVAASRLAVEPPQTEVVLRELSGTPKRFVAESFFNRRCHFVTFAPLTRLRSGRRVKVVAGQGGAA
jgi:hypothetical protein